MFTFPPVADAVNREFSLGWSPLPPLYHSVSSVTFGQNIVALRKQTEQERKYFNRHYRFSWRSKKGQELFGNLRNNKPVIKVTF